MASNPRILGISLTTIGTLILALTLIVTPTIDHLSCERQAPYYVVCKLQGFSLFWLPVRQVKFDPIQGAKRFPTAVGKGYNTQVLLLTRNPKNFYELQEIPFSRYSVPESDSIQLERDINAFLSNPNMQSFDRWHIVPLTVLLVTLSGGVIILLIGMSILWIDQANELLKRQ